MSTDKINIAITPAAIQHIEGIMQRRKIHGGLRLTMRKYGCNGFGYIPDVVAAPKENDIEIGSAADFPIYIDSNYATVLDGTVIDYVAKGLGQAQLIFNNPNAEGECGCGESVNFKVKDDG